MAEPNVEEVSAELPGGAKFKIRGSDLLGIGTMLVVLLVAYALWEHKNESIEAKREFVSVVKEMTVAQKESVQAQRVMNCLIATDQKDREAKISTCERIAR